MSTERGPGPPEGNDTPMSEQGGHPGQGWNRQPDPDGWGPAHGPNQPPQGQGYGQPPGTQQAWSPPTGPQQGWSDQPTWAGQPGWSGQPAGSAPGWDAGAQGQPTTGWPAPGTGGGYPGGGYPPGYPTGYQGGGYPGGGYQGAGYQGAGPQAFAPQPGGPQGPYPQPGQPGPQGSGWYGPPAPPPGTQPPTGQGGWPATPEPARKRNLPVIIVAIAVVVALAAGAGIWFLASRDTQPAAGQDTPRQAVEALVAAMNNTDPVGLAETLDPAEATLFTDLNGDIISELKRLQILREDAVADAMSGTKITMSNVTYEEGVETITDKVSVVKLTGGTVTVTSTPDQLPYTDKIKSAFDEELAALQPQTETFQIQDAVADLGGPIRIATVRRGDQWYPSFSYSVLDNWAHQAGVGNPTDPIVPSGSGSSEEAVDKMLAALTNSDAAGIIATLAPDEMGALQDYGNLLIAENDLDEGSSGVEIRDAQWTVSDVTGGRKVALASATLVFDGEQGTITIDQEAGTLTATDGTETIVVDESSLEEFLRDNVGLEDVDPKLLEIANRVFKQLLGVGIVTVEVDGQWYVSPVRSFSDVAISAMRALEPGDIDYFIELAGR